MSELLMASAERLFGEKLAYDEMKQRAEAAERKLAEVEKVLQDAEIYLRDCANSPVMADKCRAALAQKGEKS